MFAGASDRVKIAFIVAGAVVLVALVLVLGWLINAGKDTTQIMALVSVVIVPILLAALGGQVAQVRQQTNGNHDRLMQLVERSTLPAAAVLPPPPSEPVEKQEGLNGGSVAGG